MDFTTIDTATRIFFFTAIFAATALSAAWMLTTIRNQSSSHQFAAIAGALATIPAAVSAPIAPAGMFNVLAFVAIGGLALTLTSVVLTALRTSDGEVAESPESPFQAPVAAQAPMPVMVYAAASPAPVFEPPAASTRVASFESLTSAGAPSSGDPEVAHTLIHGASFKPVSRIAFLAQQTGDGTSFKLGDDTHIGRGPGSTVVLEDADASREHCRVKFENARFVLYDLGGLNGTYLQRDGRKRKITTATMLNDRDVIVIGHARLAFFEVENC